MNLRDAVEEYLKAWEVGTPQEVEKQLRTLRIVAYELRNTPSPLPKAETPPARQRVVGPSDDDEPLVDWFEKLDPNGFKLFGDFKLPVHSKSPQQGFIRTKSGSEIVVHGVTEVTLGRLYLRYDGTSWKLSQ